MTSERWREIETLYRSALQTERKERVAFLAQACGRDEDLRRELESLLRYAPTAGAPRPAAPMSPPDPEG